MTWIAISLWLVASLCLGVPLGRSVLRSERRLTVLVAFGVVAGYSVQAILLIFLWGIIPLGSAFWVVVVVSATAGALLLHFQLQAGRYAEMTWALSPGALFAVASLPVFAVLAHTQFTLGYSTSSPEALWWHSALVGWLQRTPFPPMSPLEPDDPLQYRLGLHLVAAAISQASNALPPEAMAATISMYLPMAVLALVGISVTTFGSAAPGLLAATFGVMAASLLPLYRLAQLSLLLEPSWADRNGSINTNELWATSTLTGLNNNLTLPAGFVAATVALWLWSAALPRRRFVSTATLLAFASTAYLGMVNEVYFAATIAGMFAWSALEVATKWRSGAPLSIRPFAYSAGIAVAAYCVVALRGGLLGGIAVTGNGSGSLSLVLNAEHFGYVHASSLDDSPRWLPWLSAEGFLDTDAILVGLPTLFLIAWRVRSAFLCASLLGSAATFVLWVTVYPQRHPYDGYRFGQAAMTLYLAALPLVVAYVRRDKLLGRSRWYRWGEAAAIAALLAPQLALLVSTTLYGPPSVMSANQRSDYAAGDYLRHSETTYRVFVPLVSQTDDWQRLYRRGDGPHSAIRVLLGTSGHAVPTGHQPEFWNPEPYLSRYRQASLTFGTADLSALRIDWVYVLPAFLAEAQRASLDSAVGRGDLVLSRTFGVAGSREERWLFRFLPTGT